LCAQSTTAVTLTANQHQQRSNMNTRTITTLNIHITKLQKWKQPT